MLQAILNQFCRQHSTEQQLYGYLPPIIQTIQVRWTRHVGHCWRSWDELISNILLWTPSHGWIKAGRPKAGRPARTYIQQLFANTKCNLEDLPGAMDDREGWWERVRKICTGSATWGWWLCYKFVFIILLIHDEWHAKKTSRQSPALLIYNLFNGCQRFSLSTKKPYALGKKKKRRKKFFLKVKKT